MSFLTLHILNLTTTLAPATALHRHDSYPTATPIYSTSDDLIHTRHRVDISSSAVTAALESLATSNPRDMTVRVSAPVFIRIATPLTTSAAPSETAESLIMLESFMSDWSSLVGDPIMSKWIVVALIVSVFLNGYLLKGIASSILVSAPFPSMVKFATAVSVSSTEVEDAGIPKRLPRRWSGVGAADLQGYHRERIMDVQSRLLHSPPASRD